MVADHGDLRGELPKYGGLFVQAEDELAAVSMAIGFAYSGHLAVTGSSGPGLSLKMEALGYAIDGRDSRSIVINVQRGGPSTGLPTSVEQSDLMQAIYGSHGDTPRVVLAPKNVEDCFYIALEAAPASRSIQHAGHHPERPGARPAASRPSREPDFDAGRASMPSSISRRVERSSSPTRSTGRRATRAPGSKMAGGKYPVVTGLGARRVGAPVRRTRSSTRR